jgi:hypothetical protein
MKSENVEYVRSPFYLQTVALVSIILFPIFNLHAQGDLLIVPKRLVFENSKKAENLTLANTGTDTATYVISFENVKMTERGTMERIVVPEEGMNFAEKNLRIFPRTITLAPKETQVVKVQVVKSSELASGEYRSNLYFRSIHNSNALGDNDTRKDSTVSVQIIPVFGISIPAIIRVGDNNSSVSIANPLFDVEKDTIPIVKFTFNRSGNMSVYGDIAIDHISPYGKIVRVADAKGVAVYTPNAKRNIKIALNKFAGADLSSGKLKITYTDQSPKNKVLAEAEIELK